MYTHIFDRGQEIDLLKFAKLEAQCNKHNIEEAEKLEVSLKADGTVHKTKEAEKKAIINRWKKENKALKKFFEERKKPGKKNGRYTFRRNITDTRGHLKDLFGGTAES